MKAVIIEDDPEIVEAVSLCFDLRWPDVKVVSANEGVAGVDLIEKESPDIVILDIGLPDIDGYELCRKLRQPPLNLKIPIVMLTAMNSEMERKNALDAGANDIWSKPFEMDVFTRRLGEYLKAS